MFFKQGFPTSPELFPPHLTEGKVLQKWEWLEMLALDEVLTTSILDGLLHTDTSCTLTEAVPPLGDGTTDQAHTAEGGMI